MQVQFQSETQVRVLGLSGQGEGCGGNPVGVHLPQKENVGRWSMNLGVSRWNKAEVTTRRGSLRCEFLGRTVLEPCLEALERARLARRGEKAEGRSEVQGRDIGPDSHLFLRLSALCQCLASFYTM